LGYLAFGWVTMGQILSLPLIALGILWLVMSRRAPYAPVATVAGAPATAT
jgi:phosphatidylglycerol:prolipoprotein diacylglycerol transferase